MTAQGQPRKRSWLKTYSKVIFFCFGIVAVWICFLNIQPYVRVTEILLGIAGRLAILNLLLSIPIIGSVLSWVGSFTIPVIGFAIWAIIQFFELLPDLIKAEVLNLTPEDMKKAGIYRGITYAIDLLLCVVCFPPINGGINGFFLFISAPSLQDIDWWNLAYIAVTMFAIEALWKAYQWLSVIVSKVK